MIYVDNWDWLYKNWISEKERYNKTGDLKVYRYFLKELQKEFSKVYVELKNEAWIDFVGGVLKIASCEMKKINIKSKKSVVKKKSIPEMTDEELIAAYQKGTEWLIDRQQVEGTDRDQKGNPYDPDQWMIGLSRVEKLEKEMQKRGVAY